MGTTLISKRLLLKTFGISAALVLMLFGNISFAAKTDPITDNLVKTKLTGGTFVCGGASFDNTNFTLVGINNFNESQQIQIDRITVYNASTGEIAFDTDRGDSVPGSFNPLIGPHQRSIYRSLQFLPGLSLYTQTQFSWSSVDGTPVIGPGFECTDLTPVRIVMIDISIADAGQLKD